MDSGRSIRSQGALSKILNLVEDSEGTEVCEV